MGIALFSAASLIESLQGVIGWLAPREPRPASVHTSSEVWHHPARLRIRSVSAGRAADHALAPLQPCATATRQVARNVRAQRPLRVLRVMDASVSSSAVGRMVISGRMADVCAELDRLAALEAATPSALALT